MKVNDFVNLEREHILYEIVSEDGTNRLATGGEVSGSMAGKMFGDFTVTGFCVLTVRSDVNPEMKAMRLYTAK